MTREEILVRQLCAEVVLHGVHTDKFTELWLESGISLDTWDFEMANAVLKRHETQKSWEGLAIKALH